MKVSPRHPSRLTAWRAGSLAVKTLYACRLYRRREPQRTRFFAIGFGFGMFAFFAPDAPLALRPRRDRLLLHDRFRLRRRAC